MLGFSDRRRPAAETPSSRSGCCCQLPSTLVLSFASPTFSIPDRELDWLPTLIFRRLWPPVAWLISVSVLQPWPNPALAPRSRSVIRLPGSWYFPFSVWCVIISPAPRLGSSIVLWLPYRTSFHRYCGCSDHSPRNCHAPQVAIRSGPCKPDFHWTGDFFAGPSVEGTVQPRRSRLANSTMMSSISLRALVEGSALQTDLRRRLMTSTRICPRVGLDAVGE